MAVFLLSVHPLLEQALLHSHDYPILLIIGLINPWKLMSRPDINLPYKW